MRIAPEETACWSLDWSNGEILAIGCTNGETSHVVQDLSLQGTPKELLLYTMSRKLLTGVQDKVCATLMIGYANTNNRTAAIQPTHFFTPHQSAVRSVAWIRAPTVSADGETTSDPPTVLLTAGFDGVLNITDTRIPCPSELFRTRGLTRKLLLGLAKTDMPVRLHRCRQLSVLLALQRRTYQSRPESGQGNLISSCHAHEGDCDP